MGKEADARREKLERIARESLGIHGTMRRLEDWARQRRGDDTETVIVTAPDGRLCLGVRYGFRLPKSGRPPARVEPGASTVSQRISGPARQSETGCSSSPAVSEETQLAARGPYVLI